MTTTLETQLALISRFDELDNVQKDYAAVIVATEKKKRVRDVADSEVLEYHKELMKTAFSLKCDAAVEAGFVSTVNGHTYRTNRDDQVNFIGQYLLLREDITITEIFWKTEDAGQQPISRDDFMIVYKEALLHKNATIGRYWSKKMELDACMTHAEVRAITWEDVVSTPDPEEEVTQIPEQPTPPDESSNDDTLPPPSGGDTDEPIEPDQTISSNPPPPSGDTDTAQDPVMMVSPEEPKKVYPPVINVTSRPPAFKQNTWKPSFFSR